VSATDGRDWIRLESRVDLRKQHLDCYQLRWSHSVDRDHLADRMRTESHDAVEAWSQEAVRRSIGSLNGGICERHDVAVDAGSSPSVEVAGLLL
jgi:hypothetical protein